MRVRLFKYFASVVCDRRLQTIVTYKFDYIMNATIMVIMYGPCVYIFVPISVKQKTEKMKRHSHNL